MPYKRKRSGSTFRRRTKSRATPYRRKSFVSRLAGRRNISRIARQVVLRAAEDKEKTVDHNSGVATQLYHNSLKFIASLNSATSIHMPMQGSGDTQRNGDKIIARGFNVHLLLGQKRDRPNVTFRLMVVAQRPGTGVLNYAALFKNVSGNGMLDEINTDKVTVLYQKYWKPLKSLGNISVTVPPVGEDYATAKEYTFSKRFFIPRKKMYKFEEDGSAVHNDKELYLYVLPYDAFGTLTTDNIGYTQVWSKFLFKDP